MSKCILLDDNISYQHCSLLEEKTKFHHKDFCCDLYDKETNQPTLLFFFFFAKVFPSASESELEKFCGQSLDA